MKYLLFVYKCEDTEMEGQSLNNLIAEEISKITTSDQVKYVYGENHGIFHFETSLSFDELDIYLRLVVEDSDQFMYVITPSIGSIMSNMIEGHLEYLKNVEKTKNEKNLFYEELDDEIIDDEINFVVNFKENNQCDLTIDEILDKISDCGIESLSKSEKTKLEIYSKSI
jgi:hypothetical protein